MLECYVGLAASRGGKHGVYVEYNTCTNTCVRLEGTIAQDYKLTM